MQAVFDLDGATDAAPSSAGHDLIDAGLQPGWASIIEVFRHSVEGARLQNFLQQRRAARAVIYPPQPLRALTLTAPDAVRVLSGLAQRTRCSSVFTHVPSTPLLATMWAGYALSYLAA